MGFFSSIGNFISQNVQSAIHDVGHVVSQIAPIAVGALSIVAPPLGQVAGNLLHLNQSPTPSVDTSANDAINQLNQNQQALAQQNQALQTQLLTLSAPKVETKTNNNNLLFWLLGSLGVAILAYFTFFKSNKRK